MGLGAPAGTSPSAPTRKSTKLKIVIRESRDEVAQATADIVEDQIRRKPASILGLATGKTPMRLYEELVRRHINRGLSFSEITTFNLDEYIGLTGNDKRSYSHYMREHLFSRVDLKLRNTFLPSCPDIKARTTICEEFENQILKRGGIDLQILGIGSNGHIGFNEPSSSIGSRTRVKTLTPRTMGDNSSPIENGKSQPRLAITMGIATILDAHRIVLMATGKVKATAVAAAIEGPVSAMCPASSLQLHRDVTFIVDGGAAAELRNRSYYKRVDAIERKLPMHKHNPRVTH